MTIRRHGVFLIEVAAALVLLGALATVVAQTVAWSAAERRASERREIALAEAANAMERLAATDWESLTPEAATESRSRRPQSKCSPVDESRGRFKRRPARPPPSESRSRCSIAIKRANRKAPVRLTTWVYK